MKKLIAILMMAMIAPAAFATGGAWTNVTVTHVEPCSSQGCAPNGVVIVILSANATGTPPSCSLNARADVVIDVTSAAGAFAAAALQSAFLSGTTVSVSGVGNCNVYTGIETLSAVTE